MTQQTTPPARSRCIDRRSLLATLGGASVALAGCTTRSDSTDPDPSDADVFEDVRVDGGRLRVTVASDVSVDWIRRYGPDDSLAEKTKVAIDGRDAWFQLVGDTADGFAPGSHRIVAVEDEEPLGEQEIDLEPDVALTDFRWAKHYPEMDWDKVTSNWENSAAFALENTGTGPALLSATRWQNAPFILRTDEDEKEFERSTILPPGETTVVYAEPPVYKTGGEFFGPSPLECGKLDQETLQLRADIEPGSELSYSQTIEYGGEQGACELSIIDRQYGRLAPDLTEGGR